MSEYLSQYRSTPISKIIFGFRPKTFDVKEYNPCIYEDSLCVMCRKEFETMDHLVKCVEYGENLEIDWKDIYRETWNTNLKSENSLSQIVFLL